MPLAPTLMVQGTASSVGKSLLVTALCRYFKRLGVRVAPFKAQNMSLNAFVTRDGLEMGRAQVVQAMAAGIEPTVDMNPILLKPEADAKSQVIVQGRVLGTYDAWTHLRGETFDLKRVVLSSLERLRSEYELVLIEGAGSPAEINLQDRDIVNMFIARAADAPVLLVSDIDRGGVFASLVGTLALLAKEDRARVKGFVINKFRGDRGLLEPGLRWLEEHTSVPVLGVLPHLGRLPIADEDSLDLDARLTGRGDAAAGPGTAVSIAVVRLPHLSNHDEFQPLEHAPSVSLQFVHDPAQAQHADLVIVPGSKSTLFDLAWLRSSGFAALLGERVRLGLPVFAICGGFQMLGEQIHDPAHVESRVASAQGLGLFPVTTHFAPDKRTERVHAHVMAPGFLDGLCDVQGPLDGYVIHAGRVSRDERRASPLLHVDGVEEGARVSSTLAGTMVHGLFEQRAFREGVLSALASRRALVGAPGPELRAAAPDTDPCDRLADVIEGYCDVALLRRLVGLDS